jgi:hypothetical protein
MSDQPNYFRYIKDKKPVTFKPVEDGFVTSSGNPTLGTKYGNHVLTPPAFIKVEQQKK